MSLIVGPSGSLGAKIAFVGARPGYDETLTGMPFTGPSGELLWRLCKRLGISRNDVYTTNVCKDYSKLNSVPTEREINAALPQLREELGRSRANVFVALGGEALFALTGIGEISKWRGSVVPSNLVDGKKVLGSWHPAACLRTYHLTYVLEHDLRRVVRQSEYPEIRRPQRDYILAPSYPDCIDLIRTLRSPLSIDIETFGDQPSCLAVADSPTRAICFPFIGGPYSTNELAQIWRALHSKLQEADIIGQNIQFDTTRLERWGFRIPRLFFDTMLAHHLLWPEIGGVTKRKDRAKRGLDDIAGKHGLDFLVSIYTEEPYYKHEGGYQGDFERYWTYNCKDAACTYEVYEGERKELEKYGQWDYFQKEVMALIRPIMGMQARGLVVDFGNLNKVRDRMEREAKVLQMRFDQKVGFRCNVKSPLDITHLIQDILHLPNIKRTKTGRPSTDEDTLRQLAYNSPQAHFFKDIIDIRERRTMLSGFLHLEPDNDGRYRANYLIHGADSGRLSSQAARKGPQLQNIPPHCRKVFGCPPGYSFLQGDYRRAEAHFVGYDAREPGLMELFSNENRDPYREAASKILGVPFEEIGSKDVRRQCFKQVVLGNGYGMGPKKFVNVCRGYGIDIADIPVRGISSVQKRAEYFLESYNALYPGVRQRWHKVIREQLRNGRKLTNPFGRLRIFLGRFDDSGHLERIAFSWRPQSSVVNMTYWAIRRLEAIGLEPVWQVHDNIGLYVPNEWVDVGARLLQEAMTIPIWFNPNSELGGSLEPIDGWEKMTIGVELSVGTNASTYHPESNPNGLKEYKVAA